MSRAVEYVAYRSQGRMAGLLSGLALISLFLVFADLNALVPDGLAGRNASRGRSLEFLISMLPWFGGAGLLTCMVKLPSLFSSPMEIEITSEGISYPPALRETLPWDRVERVAIRKITMYRVLSILIKDEPSFPVKPLARKVARLNKSTDDLGDINLETMRSDGDFDALVAAVSKYTTVEPLR